MRRIFSLLTLTVLLVACSDSKTDKDYMCEPTSLSFTAAGSVQQVKIFSDYTLYIVSYPSWVSVTPRSGSGTFTANVTVGKNETGNPLNGEIRVGSVEGNSQNVLFKIPVTQAK